MLPRICSIQIQHRKHVLGHTDLTAPSWRHALGHTDHTGPSRRHAFNHADHTQTRETFVARENILRKNGVLSVHFVIVAHVPKYTKSNHLMVLTQKGLPRPTPSSDVFGTKVSLRTPSELCFQTVFRCVGHLFSPVADEKTATHEWMATYG